MEGWEGRHDSPTVILPSHPSGNPFLSQEPTEEPVTATPERAIARALEAIEATSRAIASPKDRRGRDRRWIPGEDEDKAELARRLGYLVTALGHLSFPEEALPDALSHVTEALPTGAKPSGAELPTLADALVLRTRDLKEDRYKDQIEWALKLFHGIVGAKPLNELRTADLSEFETALRGMPTGTNVRNAVLKGTMTVREAIDGSTDGEQTLSTATIAKHISFVRTLSAIAFGKGLAGDGKSDPFASFRADRVKRSRARKDFLPAELDRLFAEMERRWIQSAPDRVWISLLALFHGLRREEVCQILKTDVRLTDGVWCLHITTTPDRDDPEDAAALKRLKTENAKRVVPLHQRVLDAGFLDYVKASPGPRVFASLTRDKDGRWGGNFGKRFGELKGRAGIKGRRTLVFHSFRHTAISSMREAQWPHPIQLALSGHAPAGSANDGYGSAPSPKVTKPWVDKLTFSAAGLDSILAALAEGSMLQSAD
jgi:integrase